MADDLETLRTRRALLVRGGIGCALAAVSGVAAPARADEHSGHRKDARGASAIVVEGTREGVCGTCRFWGGMRRVSEDRRAVLAESLGWCNNADSPHFQSMRTPESGPMKLWRKWEALS